MYPGGDRMKKPKLLGVDYGDARTGLAYSDDLWITSVGAGTFKSYDIVKTAVTVAEKAKEIGAEIIVIGKPLNMDGTEGFRVDRVYQFAEELKKVTDIPLEFIDERRTTIQAYNILDELGTYGKKRKNAIDTLSAEIILQSYMDKNKRKYEE